MHEHDKQYQLFQMLKHKSHDSTIAKVWLNYINILILNNTLTKLENTFNALEVMINEFDKYNLSTDNILFLTVYGQVLREL